MRTDRYDKHLKIFMFPYIFGIDFHIFVGNSVSYLHLNTIVNTLCFIHIDLCAKTVENTRTTCWYKVYMKSN